MDKFNGHCDIRYQEKGLCYSYFFDIFNVYPSKLRIERKEYLEHISKFPDPILKYVALYLYHNYDISQIYFNNKSEKRHNVACYVLNRWLDQQKSFYTHFEKCHDNKRWWDIYIEPLWEKLEGYYKEKICERFYSYYDKEAARMITDKYGCYKRQPEDYVCYKENDTSGYELKNHDDNYINENCHKLSILFYLGEMHSLLGKNSENSDTSPNNKSSNTDKHCPQHPIKPEKINYNPVLKAEKSYFCESLISRIALPISVTVIGTIFLAFFINEITPLGSKLQTLSKNKDRLREQFNEEVPYEEYRTYRNNNQNTAREKNIIYYQSFNK